MQGTILMGTNGDMDTAFTMLNDVLAKDTHDVPGTEGLDLSDLDADTKLASPFWLICALLSNDTLSPHLVTHAEYVNLMRGCKNVKAVELDDSALLQSSEVVDGLLSELGLD